MVGSAGPTAARELERLLPKQSARLILVNDVNFLLYTPFLPEAAAGTLEPRHVVTPLRDILKRTYLRLGAVTGHDPGARTVELTHPRGRGRGAPLRPAPARARLGLAAAAGAGPRPSTRSASRASPTRSGCATTSSRRSRRRTPPRTRRAARSCSPTSSSAAATPASRRSPSCRTSPPTRWTATRAPGCTGCAGSSSRPPTGCCPRSTAELADYALRELRGRGIDIRLGTTLEEVDREQRHALDRRDASRPGPSSGPPASPRTRACATSACRSTSAAGSRSTSYLRVEGLDARLGDRRLRRRPRPATGGTCPPTAQHAIRQGPVAARNIAAELGVGDAAPVHLPRPRRRSSTSAATRRSGKLGGRTLLAASSPGGWRAPTT